MQLPISVMSIVNVTNVTVLNNPTEFDNPFQEMCDVVPHVTGLFRPANIATCAGFFVS